MVITVKQARLLAGLTQQQVAAQMDVHRQTYMKWEQNPDEIPIGKAKQFCEIVGKKIDEISFFGLESTISRQNTA